MRYLFERVYQPQEGGIWSGAAEVGSQEWYLDLSRDQRRGSLPKAIQIRETRRVGFEGTICAQLRFQPKTICLQYASKSLEVQVGITSTPDITRPSEAPVFVPFVLNLHWFCTARNLCAGFARCSTVLHRRSFWPRTRTDVTRDVCGDVDPSLDLCMTWGRFGHKLIHGPDNQIFVFGGSTSAGAVGDPT